MALLTIETYRDLTGDSDSASAVVASALTEATELVGEYLDRELESASRTEWVRIYPDRRAYPKATPVTAVADPDGTLIDPQLDGMAIYDITPDDTTFGLGYTPPYRDPGATITYTGGYTAATLPRTLRRAIAFLAKRLTELPAPTGTGVKSVSVGDVSITYDDVGDTLDAYMPGLTGQLAQYKRVDLCP